MFVERSLPTLSRQTACPGGNGWEPRGGLKIQLPVFGSSVVIGKRNPVLIHTIYSREFNMQEVRKQKRCEKSPGSREMRRAPDSYASHLIFVP